MALSKNHHLPSFKFFFYIFVLWEKTLYLMMRRVSSVEAVRFVMVVLVAVAALSQVHVAEAATCNPTELSPCLAALTSSAPPSGPCCNKLRQQRPCLCGYLRDPNLRQYVNSPNAKRVVATCGIPYPRC